MGRANFRNGKGVTELKVHNDKISRITTPFGARSRAVEVAEGIGLPGKRVIVTGASSGIGAETARAIAYTGASVTLAVRNTAAGDQVARYIVGTTGNPHISVARLDLSSRASIAEFVSLWKGPVHVLVNNAGIMASPEERTPEGWEMHFAINHLGHFALTLGLLGALSAAGNARIVVVSSSGHMLSPVIFDDIHFAYRWYNPWLAYGQSKTANILFAVAATRRWAEKGITANALHPGAIKTNLQRHIGGRISTPLELQKTTEQGAATSVLLATSPLLEGMGGRYFEDCNEAPIASQRLETIRGVAPFALDPVNADRLWEDSLRMLA